MRDACVSIYCAGFVNWTSTCGCVKSLATGQNTQEHLFELARAFRILLARRSEWSMDTIISIFDELTSKQFKVCKLTDLCYLKI